jgi:hypothetical protein
MSIKTKITIHKKIIGGEKKWQDSLTKICLLCLSQ